MKLQLLGAHKKHGQHATFELAWRFPVRCCQFGPQVAEQRCRGLLYYV
jgi:hypothetical protein